MTTLNYVPLFTASLLFLCFVTLSQAQTSAQCAQRSCYPATGDLLVGRQMKLVASSTCGLNGPDNYCIVSNLKDQEDCFICDSRDNLDIDKQFRHVPEYMLSSFDGDKTKQWWQSTNGREDVYLQLDMESEFHFTHLVMTFRTFRPAGMLIERSWDYGKTWKVYRYFAADCARTFPGIPKGEPKDIDDIICTEKYSAVEPSSGGEVIFRALKSQEPIKNPYSQKVQNLLKLTNIRLNFTKLHTLGDDILDPRPEIKRKYYYAIYDLVIRGSCSCYGHAEQCLPEAGQPRIPGMVYGQCNCTHNTTGNNCERCKDGYYDVPWRPATGDSPNECRECNCNGHAVQCRLDMAVYLASGNKSGGVCINCEHNTVGRNCERCKPLHYQDPNKDFKEPDACIPCNCDPIGGVSGGECEAKNDPAAGLVAGRCICKTNVGGLRCDQCKPGFYNMKLSNFDGCEACGCSPLGTLNQCDPITGKCTCKRFVEGKYCDRCANGYWGLGKSPAGCLECNCDVGGSYDNQCDKISGQCRCRKGITGRRCDRVKPGHYFPLPDHLVYESEDARVIGVSEVKRQLQPKNGESTWTGDGFVEARHGTAFVYPVTNVPHSGDYNIILRYETKDGQPWDAVVTITRADGESLSSGSCLKIGFVEHYRNVTVRLNPSRRYVDVPGKLCMEKGVTYDVRVTFVRKTLNGEDSLFTDSISVVPDPDQLSIFQGPDGLKRKRQMEVYQCISSHFEARRPRPFLIDICRRHIFSMSAVVYDGAIACQCDPTGTKRDINGSLICDPAGGQCKCKPNVIGQRCDRCAPGTYGFGPSGCSACDCDRSGSADSFCNIITGQCPCHSWAFGRQCSLCPPNKWGFPFCYDCKCHGHAASCNPKTGHCIDCQHNTVGKNCESCKRGFYGIATRGTPNDCQRCQCPGGSSGNKFSETCVINTATSPPSVLCDACEEGYTGKQCEECADGFYGNPLVPGGSCQRCSCNNNIDPFKTGNCDRLTGRCLQCLANTAGFNCERCKPGYYGDAIARNCTKCVCNKEGTTPGLEDTCNHVTGQCKCLPDVEGLQCDRCAEGYWNLASGKGCQQCDCCEAGSEKTICDQMSGQCHCRAGFGGSRCCECEDNYWGYPPNTCNPCDCNPAGSISLQCDRDTGLCRCKVGHVGDKCDMCAVDTTGKMPKCEICGECYYQWKGTLGYLAKNVTYEIHRASNLSVSGSGGGIYSYDREMKALEEKLRRVRRILDTQKTKENDTQKIEAELNASEKRLMDIMNITEQAKDKVNSTMLRTSDANKEIARLRKLLEELLKKGENLKKEINEVKEKNFRGAFEKIKENQKRSRAAEDRVNGSLDNIDKASKNRQHIQNILTGPPSFNDTHQKNKMSLDDIFRRIRVLMNQSEMLSAMVCGTPRDKCGWCMADGCGTCGGPGCNGTRSLAMEAVKTAMEAENAQRMREAKANASLQDAMRAEMRVNMSRDTAYMALERAMSAHMEAKNASMRMNQLIEDILKFLAQQVPDTSGAKALTEKVLNMSLSVAPDQIKKLADDIIKALNSLTGIDEILENTRRNLSRADDLKDRAEQARDKANAIKNVINNVTKALDMTEKAQQMAKDAIQLAGDDIDKAENILNQLNAELDALEKKIDQAKNTTTQTKQDLPPIKKEFDENAKNLAMAEDSTRTAHNQSKQALFEAEKLKKLFEQARGKIENKVGQVNNASQRIRDFKRKAGNLQDNLVNKIKRIEEIELETVTYDNLIDELKKLRDKMRKLRTRLEAQLKTYRGCHPSTAVTPP